MAFADRVSIHLRSFMWHITFTRIRFQRIIASSYIGKEKEDEAAAKANAPVARDKNGYKVQYPHDYDTYY